MNRPPCDDLAPLRSAWVDGGLSPADADRLTQHLAGCSACVRDVGELRRVHDLLRGATPDEAAPPAALAERLVRIAGLEAREPLWSRPFRRTRTGVLPSRRRERRRRMGGAVVASATLVSAVAVVGYAAAPSSGLAPLPDPTSATRAEFSATLSELPLGNDAVATVLMVRSDALRSTRAVTPTPVPSAPVPSAAELDERASLALLGQAEMAAAAVGYAGRQRVEVAVGTGSVRAEVDVSATTGQSTRLVVRDVAGHELMRARAPGPLAVRNPSTDLLELVGKGFTLTGTTDAILLRRPVAVLDARDPEGRLAARWWIDGASGLLLREEAYESGRLRLAVGFTSLRLGATRSVGHGPSQLAVNHTSTALLPANAATLADRGWSCASKVAGLSLVRLRSDSANSPGMLHMAYSDGVSTLSVFERRGELQGAPVGTRWDPTLHAYVSTGFPATASWQSGSTVFTVVSDGSPDLVTAAVRSLPHEPSTTPTTVARIRAGWARILHLSPG